MTAAAAERSALIERHVDLVFEAAGSLARGYRARGTRLDADDLVGWGFLGLERAARTFDGRGEFTGYAGALIRFAIRDGLRAYFGARRSGSLERQATVSLSAFEGGEPREPARPDDAQLRDELLDLEALLSKLRVRERYVLRRWSAGALYREIGAELGVTEGRISQIVRRSLSAARARAAS